MGRLRPRLVRERVRDLAELEPSFHSQGGPLWKGLASGILTFISAPLIFNWETEAQAGQGGVLEVAEFPNRVLELPTLSCLQPLAASRTSWVSLTVCFPSVSLGFKVQPQELLWRWVEQAGN